ncbi:predicted protein [Arabidopsis lyrata subsp. lyrata]|uniref:Predicted protein n=1 Tax=Arabidopsis lyrata subsp. lyrata TaxID=81972 RepID=D7M4C0_ARALL|nr:predicted protein [Arabidopsis lyrata subsp. lyrata]
MVPTPNKYKSAHLGRFRHGTAFAVTVKKNRQLIKFSTRQHTRPLFLFSSES